MNRTNIIAIVKGYENQLANAEIANDKSLIKWLNTQIAEAHRALATLSII